jgi:hypothetical protein
VTGTEVGSIRRWGEWMSWCRELGFSVVPTGKLPTGGGGEMGGGGLQILDDEVCKLLGAVTQSPTLTCLLTQSSYSSKDNSPAPLLGLVVKIQ